MVEQYPTSQRVTRRMLTFQVSMPPEMVDEIESLARKESLVKKKIVSRSSQIRQLCAESLDRRRQEGI